MTTEAINKKILEIYDLSEKGDSSVVCLEDFTHRLNIFNRENTSKKLFHIVPNLSKMLVYIDKTVKTARVLFSKKLQKQCILVSPELNCDKRAQLAEFILLHEVYHIKVFLEKQSEKEPSQEEIDKEEIDADRFAASLGSLIAVIQGLQIRLSEEDEYSQARIALLYEELSRRSQSIRSKVTTQEGLEALKKMDGILESAKAKLMA